MFKLNSSLILYIKKKIAMEKKIRFLLYLVVSIIFCLVLSRKIYAQGKRISLDSSNREISWKLKPESAVGSDSVNIFKSGYNTENWVKATVPGTVYGSYVEAGYEKDPNYADNIYNVDRAKYNFNFWYRTEFKVPSDFITEKLWLNFMGVNRDADVFLNGKFLGKIKGIMQRGKFDISHVIKKNESNTLAVLVYVPQQPLSNNDCPTYIASAGWDWMPYVPGLNMGIQDEVYLSNSDMVSIVDPWIKTELTDTSLANIKIKTELENHSDQEKKGVFYGTINPGNISFFLNVTLPPHRIEEVYLDGNGFPQLLIKNPLLWWPNGYGAQYLYKCNMGFKINNAISDKAHVNFGIRKIVIDTSGSIMKIVVNGVKIFVKGGNWGMPEYMLRCKNYDVRVKLHKDMNFNIIRNWIGSTTNHEFYDACDKYGIMVWDDFWLNWDGGLPRDINIFNENAVEKIKRLRNHPCIVLWCGENEGWPVPPLNDWLRADVKTFDGRYYQPNSHAEGLTGSGPWHNLNPIQYFNDAAPGHWGGNKGWGMRSEIGSAVFVNFGSFKEFMPENTWWPRNKMWNAHFFGSSAANAGPDNYYKSIIDNYGAPNSIKDFCKKAQLLNIVTSKAMFEGWLDNMWNNASGIIIWMSQSAYPSMVWQTYDYYLDATGAYWGAKEACEPIHIQWNPSTNSVKVINTTLNNLTNLSASAKIYSLDGIEIKGLKKSTIVDVKEDSLAACFDLNFPDIDLAQGKKAYTSTVVTFGELLGGEGPENMVDGKDSTKWESDFSNQQWACIDLGSKREINEVKLKWDKTCAKVYKIQLSNDAQIWHDVFYTEDGKPGLIDINFKTEEARFVRMYCIQKNTPYMISLWSFEVFNNLKTNLSEVYFIKLQLKDRSGKTLSENFYWKSKKPLDYKVLNELRPVNLDIKTETTAKDGKYIINAEITNPESSTAIAFTIHLQVVKKSNGERILPVFMNDNYFSLVKGETKNIHIQFDKSLVKGDEPILQVEPFNSIINK